MHKIFNKACDALEKIEQLDREWSIMDENDRKAILELLETKYKILKIRKLEEEMDGGYSLAAAVDSQNDMGDGYSNRSRHWVRGHYSRDGRGGGYDDGYSMARDIMGRYSRDGDKKSKEEMMGFVDAVMSAAPDERFRKAAMDFKEELKRM